MTQLTMTVAEIVSCMGRPRLEAELMAGVDSRVQGRAGHIVPLILDRFWCRQIGMETVDLWLWQVRRILTERSDTIEALYQASDAYAVAAAGDQGYVTATRGRSATTASRVHDANSNSGTSSLSQSYVTEYAMPATAMVDRGSYATGGTGSQSESSGTGSASSSDRENNAGSGEHSQTSSSVSWTAGMGRAQAEYLALIRTADEAVLDMLEPTMLGVWEPPLSGFGQWWPRSAYHSRELGGKV